MIDDTWVIQPKHGPFSADEAPRHAPNCTRETCKQYDHWAGRLSDDLSASPAFDAQGAEAAGGFGSGAEAVQHIADFRARFGEATWLNEELRQLDAFQNAFKGGEAATFEDTSADGNSDGVWSHK